MVEAGAEEGAVGEGEAEGVAALTDTAQSLEVRMSDLGEMQTKMFSDLTLSSEGQCVVYVLTFST